MMGKAACKRWFQSKKIIYGKITYICSLFRVHLISLQVRPGLRRTWAFSTPKLRTIIPQREPSSQVTVSRPLDAGPSEESDQLPVRESHSMEATSVGSGHGSTPHTFKSL